MQIIDDKDNVILSEMIPAHYYWNRIEDSFSTKNDVTGHYKVSFINFGGGFLGTTQIKNIQLKKEDIPNVIIKRAGDTIDSKLPSIKVASERITQYKISISNASDPFILVFKDSFSPNWQAKLDNQFVKKHIEANLIFNGWFIDKKGSYDIVIDFSLQKQYLVSVLISLTSITLLVSLFLIRMRYGNK